MLLHKDKISFFSKISRLVLGTTQTSTHWVLGASSSLVKQLGCEAHTIHLYLMLRGSVTPLPIYLHTIHTYSFNLPFFLNIISLFLYSVFCFSVRVFICIFLYPSFTKGKYKESKDINMCGKTDIMHRSACLSRKKLGKI